MTGRIEIDDLYRIALVEQPALSPDGAQVVYVLRTADREADRDVRSLWRVAASGGEPHRLTRGPADSTPVWSPDGTWLAFLRSVDGPAQVWLLPAGGGEAEPLTALPLGAGTPVWSPDGSAIAFAAPTDPAGGERSAPVATDRLGYKADGVGLIGTVRRHLHVLDLDSREVRAVTDGDWHASDPAWSPDGTMLAFASARDPDADLTMRSAAYVVEARADAPEPRPVGAADGQAGPVTWTPDGRALLVVGRRDTATGHAGLLRVPLDGGDPLDLAAPLDRNVMPGGPGYPGALPAVSGGEVYFCVRDRGCSHLYATALDGGAPRRVLGGPGDVVQGMSAAAGTAAVALATPSSYGEIVRVDLRTGERTVLTAHGASLGDAELFTPEEREFTVSDGTVVHGWLIRDPARTGPRPLLLDIHGGPHNAWHPAADPAHLYHQELAARGWTVLLLNPRASDGYGEAFFTAALGGWGEADARDLLEPIDQLVAAGKADPDRLAIAGYSYGGFMTCYLTSRDDRFSTAVAGGVVADLTSEAGTADLGHHLSAAELGGTPWADRARFAELSPLAAVEHVRTPTLVLHGADDERCPAGQAEQWFTALRERGVPSRLVLYPGASHLFILNGRPSHRADYNRRVVAWVERKAPIDAAHWQRRLDRLARRHKVPGAVLGVLRIGTDGAGDESMVAATGVLNTRTGVAVTEDSLFQIGSITKTWTAAVVMQLVDEGLLDLDAPIADALPGLRLSDVDVAAQVTMRHLLSHTSGIDGDIFTDTGRGDDCLERYVAELSTAAQNHPLGATFSYCNSGYTLAGRVIEHLTGMTWDAALRSRLIAPLGLEHTVTLPEEALLHRTAVGHLDAADGPRPAPVWTLPRSAGPAGLICASAADVLSFARTHLTGGAASEAMAAHQADVPDKHSLGDSWGLGWIRFGWDGARLIGHDGNTLGQSAFLRLLPEQGLAVVLLTNGGNTKDLYHSLYREIFADLAALTMPEPLSPADVPPTVDASRHLGTYERAGVRLEVFLSDDRLRLRQTTTGPLAALVPEPVQEHDLVAIDDSLFVLRPPGTQTWIPVTFYTLPTGEQYLHTGLRANPKVS
ncbi:serine hydrolase [Dactylosporangium sp. CS-047395]|uniref:serine hydrolase n=1 Tax=Dactylosporangium sp. CS-047395 TaxID=3239936 RepID=UPI003D928034